MTLDLAWQMFGLLKHAMSEKLPKNVEEELNYIMDHAKDGTMRKCVELMYDHPDTSNPFETILMFMRGIQKNEFMTFIAFIRGLYGSPRR